MTRGAVVTSFTLPCASMMRVSTVYCPEGKPLIVEAVGVVDVVPGIPGGVAVTVTSPEASMGVAVGGVVAVAMTVLVVVGEGIVVALAVTEGTAVAGGVWDGAPVADGTVVAVVSVATGNAGGVLVADGATTVGAPAAGVKTGVTLRGMWTRVAREDQSLEEGMAEEGRTSKPMLSQWRSSE